MLVLYETPAGYAIFKLLDEKVLKKVENLHQSFQTPEAANGILKLKHFQKFFDTTEALASTTSIVEGKISKPLNKAIKKALKESTDSFLIADAKLGSAIKDKFDISVTCNSAVQELMRCIRIQTDSLLAGVAGKDQTAMALGLAHSLSRYKLKFSPDKVDVMIIQAIGLLDELDKELNNYVMRVREWYGWHFPEMGKIVTDNTVYVKVVFLVGTKDNFATIDLSDVLSDEVLNEVKEAAEVSIGTQLSDEDVINIQQLCKQIIDMTQYRSELSDYLKARVFAIAPNLSVLLGEVISARLIAHSGSLINLAKQPASTLQITGAEKALFRALKTKQSTPKYGLIYTTALINEANSGHKGKVARSLAAKASLAARIDALGDDASNSSEWGQMMMQKIIARLAQLKARDDKKFSGNADKKSELKSYQGKSKFHQYDDHFDNVGNKRKRNKLIEEISENQDTESPPQKKKKIKKEPVEKTVVVKAEEQQSPKKKKKIKQEKRNAEEMVIDTVNPDDGEGSSKKKKKKVKQEE